MFLNDAIGRWNHFKTEAILCKFLLMILPYQNKVYNNNNNNDGMGWDGMEFIGLIFIRQSFHKVGLNVCRFEHEN
jgi:hypothetical protein